MNVALIVPKGSKYGKNKYLKDFLQENDTVYHFYGSWESPNLGLLTIAGETPDDVDLTFIDEDHGQIIDFDAGYDLVCITGMTQQANRAYEIAAEFRIRNTYVAMGGIHASILQAEAANHVDTVLVGEGEKIWPQFLQDFKNGTPKPLYVSQRYINLEQVHTPRYDLVDKSRYSSYSVQITRGCPRSCDYCTLPIMYGKSYRHKTIEQVIREVSAIQAIDKNAFIFFADDNMFIDRDFSKELLGEIERLGIKWGTQTDISVANDDDLLKRIHASGCRWLFIGFENVTNEGLRFLDHKEWKAKQLATYERSINKIHSNNLQIWGSFMFGGDGDTTDVFNKTLDFALRNELYSGSFTILTPLPGTGMFQYMRKQNRIIDYDWSRYTFWDVVFKPYAMTPDELAKGVAWVYENFYSLENIKKRTSKICKRIRKHAYE
jgi:radical SAM superfamily enzyme YgiQ (UPF0313 family)